MLLLAGRHCSSAGRLIAVHRRFATQRGLGRVNSAMPRARVMGNAREWDERERGRERANYSVCVRERATSLHSCAESCLVLSVRVSHAIMCVDDCSAFRWGKTGLQIRQLQIFVVTTVCGSATVLTVAKSSRQRSVRPSAMAREADGECKGM